MRHHLITDSKWSKLNRNRQLKKRLRLDCSGIVKQRLEKCWIEAEVCEFSSYLASGVKERAVS